MHVNWRNDGGCAELTHTPFSRCASWRRHRILAAESAPCWPAADVVHYRCVTHACVCVAGTYIDPILHIKLTESDPAWRWSSPGGEGELPVDSGAEPRGRVPQCPRPPRLRGAVRRLPLPRRVLRHAAPRQARRLLLHQLSSHHPGVRPAGGVTSPSRSPTDDMIGAGKPSGPGEKNTY